MKIIDKTPFKPEDESEIDILGKIQLMFKYGFAFPKELDSQAVIIDAFEKSLPRSSVLLRNVTLPELGVMLPLVLLCPAGVFLINTVYEKGVYQAREREWGRMSGQNFSPDKVNLVDRTARMARALQVYLDRQGFQGMLTVEPILMATDPGIHIETVRPAVRVVMMDALDRFAASMTQARAVLTPEFAASLTHVILTGKGGKSQSEPVETETEDLSAFSGAVAYDPSASVEDASLSFDFADEPDEGPLPAALATDADAASRPQTTTGKPRKGKRQAGPLGFTPTQWMILGGMLVLWICLMVAFFVFINFYG